MVNIFRMHNSLLSFILKLAGLRSQRLETEPGTIINFWAPNQTKNKTNKPKKNVVFLHPFAANGIFCWQFQIVALAKEYAVYVPDFLFFGDSITERADRSPEFQAECVAKGLKKLGVEKCTLVGSSYGGMVGFKMAQLFPNMVESMVVSCSVMALTESVSSESLRRIGYETWSDCLIPKTVEGVRAMFDVGIYKLPNVPDWIFKHFLEEMFSHRKEKKELLEALIVSDKDFSIPQYPQRVGLLWGQNDKIFNMETATNINKQLGERAMLESIEKTGHLVQLERPCIYNKQLKKILASLLQDN